MSSKLEKDTTIALLTTEEVLTSNQEEVKVDKKEVLAELYEASGGFGRFQYCIFFVFQSAMSAYSLWFYGLGFLTQVPDYSCVFSESGVSQDICTAEKICDGDPRILSWEIDWDSSKSLYNWQQKLDLMCRPEWQAGFIGTIYFIGYVVTLLWIPRLADAYGRKKIFAWGMAIQSLFYTILMFT